VTDVLPQALRLIDDWIKLSIMSDQLKKLEANTTLKQSRDLLLSRLISGKLDVEALNITSPLGMLSSTQEDA
jgi:hypothetical protein